MATWIFQGSPHKFDIEGYLDAGLDEITWLVRRQGAEIEPGDRVFIWQAGGKQKAKSGILASTLVSSKVEEIPDDERAAPFWIDQEGSADTAPRVSGVTRTE